MLTFVVTGPIVEHSGPQAALLTANGLYAVVFVMCFLLGFVSRHRQHNTLTSLIAHAGRRYRRPAFSLSLTLLHASISINPFNLSVLQT